MWRKGNPCALLVGMQIGAATVESSVELPQNNKNGTALRSSGSTSGNLSEETWNTNLKEHMQLNVHCCVIHNSQGLEAAQISLNRWVCIKAEVHLHNGILLSCKIEGHFTLCNCMDGPGEYYAKWNKPVRGRQVPYDFTHTWNLMNKTTYKQNRDRIIELADSCQVWEMWRCWTKKRKNSWTWTIV